MKEHLLYHGKGTVSIDPKQDFSTLCNRWESYKNGEFFHKEYEKFRQDKMVDFFIAFRGKNLLDKLIRKFLGNEWYLKYVSKKYTDKQILRIISICQGEEHREEAICGLQSMIGI